MYALTSTIDHPTRPHTPTHHTHTQDGRLRKNDQLLYVNKEGLLGCSNQQALDKLRTALAKASNAGEGGVASSHVELVVARRMCNAGSSQSPSMAALGEVPEDEVYNPLPWR